MTPTATEPSIPTRKRSAARCGAGASDFFFVEAPAPGAGGSSAKAAVGARDSRSAEQARRENVMRDSYASDVPSRGERAATQPQRSGSSQPAHGGAGRSGKHRQARRHQATEM